MRNAAFGLMVGILAAAAVAAPTTLSYSEEVGGTGGWANNQAYFSYEVTIKPTYVSYAYELYVGLKQGPGIKEISHLSLDVSDNFGEGDFLSRPLVWIDGNPVDSYDLVMSTGSIKFEDFFDSAGDKMEGTLLRIEFDSTRLPMDGDFYAKGGTTDTIWNKPPILVPDTTVIIPVPGALGLAVLGLGLVASRRR